jgi:hypothetical protein
MPIIKTKNITINGIAAIGVVSGGMFFSFTSADILAQFHWNPL